MTNCREFHIVCKAFIALLFFSTLFISCQKKEVTHGELRPYYFPLDSLFEGRVLHYVSTGDTTMSDQFWYLKSKKNGATTLLKGQIYDGGGQMTHQWSEQFTSSGMIMTEYAFAYRDAVTGKTELHNAGIKYDDIFPFAADSGGIFLFRMEWSDMADTSQKMTLIRNRIYLGDTLIRQDDQVYEAKHFVVRDRIEADRSGILGLDVFGREIYVNNKGLMRYSKTLDAEKHTEYTLRDVYSIPAFRSKFAWNLTPMNE